MNPISASVASGVTRPTAAPARSSTRPTAALPPSSTRPPPPTPRDAVAAARKAVRRRRSGPPPRSPNAPRCWTGSPTCCSATRRSLAELETSDTGKTLAESRIDIDDVDVGVPLLRQAGRRRVGPARRRRRSRGHQPGGTRTHRRVRADRAVELPAAADRPGRSRPRWPPAAPWSPNPARSPR